MMLYLQYPLYTILSDDESGIVAEMNSFHNLNHNETVLDQKSRQNLIFFFIWVPMLPVLANHQTDIRHSEFKELFINNDRNRNQASIKTGRRNRAFPNSTRWNSTMKLFTILVVKPARLLLGYSISKKMRLDFKKRNRIQITLKIWKWCKRAKKYRHISNVINIIDKLGCVTGLLIIIHFISQQAKELLKD